MSIENARQAQRKKGHTADDDRPAGDFYRTPAVATRALLANVSFPGRIYEPACGDGAISKILEAYGYTVVSTDLADHGFGTPFRDFLSPTTSLPGGVRSIITNPPYNQATAFVRRSLAMLAGVQSRTIAALLLRHEYDAAISRKDLLTDHLSEKLVFSRRLPFMHRPGWKGPKASPMIDFAWYIFEQPRPRPHPFPIIKYVDWKDYDNDYAGVLDAEDRQIELFPDGDGS